MPDPQPPHDPRSQSDPLERDAQAQQRRTGVGMTVIAWLILLGLFIAFFNDREAALNNPNRDPTSYREGERNVLVLEANRQEHYVVSGRVNGKRTTLLLDTGATLVSVPADLGQKLGLERGPSGTAYTANGPVTVYRTRIDRLELGSIVLYDVAADLNPGMNGMNEILLGMSALSQLEFTQRDGQLILMQ